MTQKIDRDKILGRLDTNLTAHYLSLEVTVVGVALAMAGVALADLITEPYSLGVRLVLLWLLWVGGVLAIAVAYAGPMIGAFALPPSIPTVIDLLPSLAMGVVEFLMFAVLIRQVTPGSKLDTVVNTWLWVMAAFGVVAFLTIVRARYLLIKALSRQFYEPEIDTVVAEYVSYLGNNLWGPLPLVAVATTTATLWSAQARYEWLGFLAVGLIIVLLATGLMFHRRTARMWRRSLDLDPEQPPSLLQLLLRRRIGASSEFLADASAEDLAEP
jgi:hypothetical protein